MHNGKGSHRNFRPSLNGRSARQTASTRVGELSIRYMRPFRTSLTEIYSYGTTVHMSIFFSRFMRDVQIMRYSRLARSTGSRYHRTQPVDPCRARGVGSHKASKHADPMSTARMRSAARWASSRHESRARRRVTKSRFRLVSTLSAAAHDHLTHPTDATHRAAELSMLQLVAKLM